MTRLAPLTLVALVFAVACGGSSGGSADGGSTPDAGGGGQKLPDGGSPVCGNGALEPGEGCDDGNTTSKDGCSSACQPESGFQCKVPGEPCTPLTGCGNGVLETGEACDDGNLVANDGCSVQCKVETGWYCPHAGLACHTKCGDGIRAGNEQCDDGNAAANDGCSSLCQLEDGWQCDGGTCSHPVCGNGVREGAEQCDDGNHDTGDGCSPRCALEPSCNGGTCVPTCGDGVLEPGEQCDDGNLRNGDGCSSLCEIESDWSCSTSTALPANGLDLTTVFRDFCGTDVKYKDGGRAACAHPDFQAYGAPSPTTGLVQTMLDTAGKPVCHTPVNSSELTDCTLFDNTWYRDVAATNLAQEKIQNLTRVGTLHLANQGSYYGYDSQLFFPWDGLGWVAAGVEPTRVGEDGKQHNFSFTTEARYWFTFAGTGSVAFTGDDDVWIFINRTLAMDLGGLHPASSGVVDFTDGGTRAKLGLKAGGTYELAVFQAERHSDGSHYNFSVQDFGGATHSVCRTLCGDGTLQADAGEQCDDGNTVSGDGCSSTCFKE